MIRFHIAGIADEITSHVRETHRAPGYGHPAHRETATGTGPCRACLDLFVVGAEERLLFTYRPAGGNGTLAAPGPVFIHSEACQRYRGESFPPGLRPLPLCFEAHATGNRIVASRDATGDAIDTAIEELLGIGEVEYLHVRHGEAGCHIARIDRGPLPD